MGDYNNYTLSDQIVYCEILFRYETSSSAIATALYELARNPNVQNKLREELKESMPNDEDCTYDKIMENEYLEQVWNENLRFLNTHKAL